MWVSPHLLSSSGWSLFPSKTHFNYQHPSSLSLSPLSLPLISLGVKLLVEDKTSHALSKHHTLHSDEQDWIAVINKHERNRTKQNPALPTSASPLSKGNKTNAETLIWSEVLPFPPSPKTVFSYGQSWVVHLCTMELFTTHLYDPEWASLTASWPGSLWIQWWKTQTHIRSFLTRLTGSMAEHF